MRRCSPPARVESRNEVRGPRHCELPAWDEKCHASSGIPMPSLVRPGIARHTCRTFWSTSNENNRLAIITFSNRPTLLQNLTVKMGANNRIAEENMEKTQIQGARGPLPSRPG